MNATKLRFAVEPEGRSSPYACRAWIDLDSLIAIKSAIDHPRHREDARVLRQVKALRDGE